MNNFEYYNPTKIIFGENTISKIVGELIEANVKKTLFIYGEGSIKRSGLFDDLIHIFEENKICFVEMGGIKPNPTLEKVNEGINIARSHCCDSILAVGGGSVIDVAKVVAAGVFYKGDIWNGFENTIQIDETLPIYTILTCSGTGSEMNPGAIITHERDNKKWSFSYSKLLYPTVSIIDPVLQYSLSWNKTCLGAIDAISHVMEYYFNGVKDVDLQDDLSLSLIRNIIKHTKILKEYPKCYQSRAQLAWSCTMALNGMNAIGRFGGDFSSHTIEHSLSAFYNIPHGEGLAIIFPAWLQYVSNDIEEKLCILGEAIFGLKNAKPFEVVGSFRRLFSTFGIKTQLREIGVFQNTLKLLATNATLQGKIGRIKKLSITDVENILELAY